MAEIAGQPPAPLPTAEEVAKHNAEVTAKVAGQDAAGNPRPDPLEQAAAGDALDALAKQVEAKANKEVDVEPEPPKAADKPTVEPKTTDDPAAKAAAEEAAKKEAADKEAREAELKKADDIFKDAPTLPQGASVKSHEAFSSIKVKAAQEISKLSSELENLKKSLADKEAAAGKPSPEQEQILKENEELKKWRAKLDVEFDPKFREHDQEVEQGREFIYSQLKKAGISDNTIDTIKKYGGPDKILMKPVMDALPDEQSKQLVTATLADIEKSKYKKEQVIAQTKANIDEYIKSKNVESSKAATVELEGVKKELDGLWGNLDWTKPKQIPQGATDADKAAIETHNKFTDQIRKELETAMADNSPKMKATLLVSAAQLFNLQSVHKALKDSFSAMEKEVKELREFKAKLKNATRSRLQESQAPSSGAASMQKPVNQFNTGAADGLDAIAKQVMQERAAKAGHA
jgi:hypothetical protein